MPITTIINTIQGTSVHVTNPRTLVSVLPINTTGGGVSSVALLSDVSAPNPNNNETLIYDSTINKYVAKIIPVLQGGTF